MKRLLIIVWGASLGLTLIGCGNTAPTNANDAAPQNSNTTDSNTNTTADTLPEFSDAATALAEGNKYFDINKTELAIAAYKKAVELDPDLGEAWFKLGVAHSLIEREKELESVNDQTEYTPTPTPSKKEKDVVRTKDSEKAFEKAVKAYRKQLSANPKDDVAHFNLGRTLEKLDEDEDALKSMKEAVKLKPESTEYQTGLGSILIKLAQYDEAVRALKKAIEIDPENSQADELLAKAEAGKRRISFGVTPKPQQTTGSMGNTKVKPPTDDAGGDALPPTSKPTSAKPTPAKTTPKLGKKGDQ
jgi:tetratricopeptide (TPR) repeat protein